MAFSWLVAVLFFPCTLAFYLHLHPVEWTNAADYIDNRTTTASASILNQYYCLYHTSRNNTVNSLDGVYGVVYTGGQPYCSNNVCAYQYPTSQLGFFANYAKWNAANPVNGDYSSTTGFIATSYLTLDEVNANGVSVQTVNLNTLPWVIGSTVTRESSTSVRLTGGVSAAAFTAFGNNNNNQNQQQNQQQQVQTVLYGNLSVSLTLTVGNHSGMLFTGGGFLSTKSVGLEIEIFSFPYVNTANSLRLTEVYVTATADSVISTNQLWNGFSRTSVGTTHFDTGVSGVYFDLDRHAYANGAPVDAALTSWTATYTDLRNYKLYAMQLTQMVKLGRQLNYFGFNITFPAGASNISYSQVYGVGSGPDAVFIPGVEEDAPQQTTASALILGLTKEAFGGVIAGSIIGVVLLALFVIFFFRLRAKRQDYPAAINENNTTTDQTQTENTGLVPSDGQHNKYQALA